MKRTLWAVSICTGLLLAASAPAWAHHAFQAEFDQRKPIKLEGKVTDMEWINPHAWIHIDVKNPDGTVTNWMVECGSPNIMLRRGFTKRPERNVICTLPADGAFRRDNVILENTGFGRRVGRDLGSPNRRRVLRRASRRASSTASASSSRYTPRRSITTRQ